MCGSYREANSSAGLTFRLEFLVNTLFEEVIEDFNLASLRMKPLNGYMNA
jgi:hypothetical protein